MSLENKKKLKKLVTFGASILERSFEYYGNERTFRAELYDAGFTDANFFPRAVGGEDSAALAARIDTVVAEFAGEDGVVFIVHAGGNDVSATRPYSSASLSDKQNLAVNIQYIVDAIKNAGFECIFSPISYRSYADVPPENNGSLPYNENIINPIIRASLPCWFDPASRSAIFDLYSLMKRNKNYIDPDGVHPNTEGQAAIRSYVVNIISNYYENCRAPSSPNSGSSYVVDCGSPLIVQNNAFINHLTGGGYHRIKFSLGMSGAYFVSGSLNGPGDTGRGNAGDTSTSLSNNDLLESFWFISTDNISSAYIGGIIAGVKGKISFTASRDVVGSDRVSTITYNGVSKDLDATQEPAQVVDFDFTVGEDGKIPFTIQRKAGSTFGYLSGIEVLFY